MRGFSETRERSTPPNLVLPAAAAEKKALTRRRNYFLPAATCERCLDSGARVKPPSDGY